MGADGGLEFMSLKKPEKHDRLIELVAPFHVLYYQNESADMEKISVYKKDIMNISRQWEKYYKLTWSQEANFNVTFGRFM